LGVTSRSHKILFSFVIAARPLLILPAIIIIIIIIIIIHREVTANRSDITENKKEKTCTLIDVAIPADRNVVQKEAEKKLKYKSLCIEIQRMWNLKCTTIPVIIGASGIVTRSLRKNLEAVPGKHSIDSLQKNSNCNIPHTHQQHLHDLTDTTTPAEARKRWKF